MPKSSAFVDKRESLPIGELIEAIQQRHSGLSKEQIANEIGRNRTYLSKPISKDEERQVKALLIYRFLGDDKTSPNKAKGDVSTNPGEGLVNSGITDDVLRLILQEQHVIRELLVDVLAEKCNVPAKKIFEKIDSIRNEPRGEGA